MPAKQFKTLKHFVVGLFIGALALNTALSQHAPGKVDFRRDVQPIFKQFCIECHGPSQQQHGFRLDRRRDALRGSIGTVIAPGNSAGSHGNEQWISAAGTNWAAMALADAVRDKQASS